MNVDWYSTDFDHDSDVLLISMGSQKRNPKKFEWRAVWTFKHSYLTFKKMYLTDRSRSWWHAIKEPEFNGKYGILALCDFIKDKIDEAGVKRVYIMGSSMGGYGAILMGALLDNINEVFAYSPQTFLTRKRYVKTKLDQKFENLDIDYSLTDVADVLNESKTETIYHLFYPQRNKSDVQHIKRVKHFPNIKIYPVDQSGHVTSSRLCKNGTVTKILRRIVDEDINVGT